jgi:hypothetical protein
MEEVLRPSWYGLSDFLDPMLSLLLFFGSLAAARFLDIAQQRD